MTHGAPASESPLVDELIPPGGHWGRRMAAGEVLRIVDLEGRQAVDFLCYDAERPEERYNAADTMKLAGSIFIGRGTRLLSDMGRTLMTVVEDTVGRHDTIGGCCSKESNRLRYGVDDTPNCRDNFLAALKPEIRLPPPPTALRRLHSVPGGRKLGYGHAVSGNRRSGQSHKEIEVPSWVNDPVMELGERSSDHGPVRVFLTCSYRATLRDHVGR